MAFVSFLLIVTISPFVDFDIYTFNMKQKKACIAASPSSLLLNKFFCLEIFNHVVNCHIDCFSF